MMICYYSQVIALLGGQNYFDLSTARMREPSCQSPAVDVELTYLNRLRIEVN